MNLYIVILVLFSSLLVLLVHVESKPSPSSIYRGPVYSRYLPQRKHSNPAFEKKTFQNLKSQFHSNYHHHDENPPHDSWELAHNSHEMEDNAKAKEIVKFINQFLDVMGPFLFPLPYVLALIPFAIPAIPLSFWLESREHHSPSEPEHGEQPTTPMSPSSSSSSSNTTPKLTMTTRPSSTTSSFVMNPTFSTIVGPFPTTFANFQTTSSPTAGLGENTFTNSSSLTTDFPMMNVGAPATNPVTLFPFTLFLNSSFLGEDYLNEGEK
ncbi:uncharacterized protein LOC110843445 [Folsomia candida]|uniref:Uncharacterized protein n=1 Tax=Folsomia candida TaxID=158441 RepID=A0A226EUW1_FOLCA|nr:uncharacterized protein LOC110843445 [Folsomia candida]OXA60854.1 hypothetical protein Fcan01_05707 [Folsomia candida]